MYSSPKLRITQSLLSSWLYTFKTDNGYEDFLRTLNREKKQPTQAMLDGIRYENCLNNILNGEPLYEDHEWYNPLMEMSCELQGAQQQVTLFKDINVYGYNILLHGVLDYLREGHVWDCKYSKTYQLNKYLNSPQHPMYLALAPEARDFTYIITDGKYVYRERYQREIVPDITVTIKQFLVYLQCRDLFDTFVEKWRVKS